MERPNAQLRGKTLCYNQNQPQFWQLQALNFFLRGKKVCQTKCVALRAWKVAKGWTFWLRALLSIIGVVWAHIKIPDTSNMNFSCLRGHKLPSQSSLGPEQMFFYWVKIHMRGIHKNYLPKNAKIDQFSSKTPFWKPGDLGKLSRGKSVSCRHF